MWTCSAAVSICFGTKQGMSPVPEPIAIMMRVVEVILAIDAIPVQRNSACVTRFERQMISSSKKFKPPNWGDACEPKLSKAASLLQHATACGGGGGHTRFSRGRSPHLVVFEGEI